MTLSLDTAYRSFGGEVEASSTPTICRLPDSRRHQLWAIARSPCRCSSADLRRPSTTLWCASSTKGLALSRGSVITRYLQHRDRRGRPYRPMESSHRDLRITPGEWDAFM